MIVTGVRNNVCTSEVAKYFDGWEVWAYV